MKDHWDQCELGCWCKPSPCHGDILIKLLKERQGKNLCSLSRSNNQELTSELTQCGRYGDDDADVSDNFLHAEPYIQDIGNVVNDNTTFAPLRLNGGGETSFEVQEDEILSFIDQDNSMSEQDIRDILFEAGYNFDEINDIFSAKAKTSLNKLV